MYERILPVVSMPRCTVVVYAIIQWSENINISKPTNHQHHQSTGPAGRAYSTVGRFAATSIGLARLADITGVLRAASTATRHLRLPGGDYTLSE